MVLFHNDFVTMTGKIPDVIYTAGYGNRGFDGFIELMRSFQITHIVDVRSVPSSSFWEDFRRENLIDSIPKVGFKYVYMGDKLGGVQDSPVLCKDPESVDLAPLFVSEDFLLGLTTLINAAQQNRKICLMCGCKRPHQCHRSRLIGAALLNRGIDLAHIDADDTILLQSKIDRFEQASLF